MGRSDAVEGAFSVTVERAFVFVFFLAVAAYAIFGITSPQRLVSRERSSSRCGGSLGSGQQIPVVGEKRTLIHRRNRVVENWRGAEEGQLHLHLHASALLLG
jgi:hypothetical protein